jgi:hypothetical protein
MQRNFLENETGLLLNSFTRRVIKLAVVTIEAYHCYQLNIKYYA